EESCAAVNVGAQHAQAFVSGIPGLDHDVIQLVAQEVFDDAFESGLDFEEVGEYTHRRAASLHYAGLKEAADGLGGISVLGDNGLERTLFAECGRVLGAENVEMGLGPGFLELLRFDQAAKLADFFADAADALADGFEFEGELATLAAKGLNLKVGVGDFGFEAASVAVGSGQAFFGLRELVAQTRRGGNRVEDSDPRFFLPALDFGQTHGCSRSFLLAECKIALSGGDGSRSRFEDLAIRFAFRFERGETMASLG